MINDSPKQLAVIVAVVSGISYNAGYYSSLPGACNEKIGPGEKIGPAGPVLVDQNWSIFGIQNWSRLTKIGPGQKSCQTNFWSSSYELWGVANVIIVLQTI